MSEFQESIYNHNPTGEPVPPQERPSKAAIDAATVIIFGRLQPALIDYEQYPDQGPWKRILSAARTIDMHMRKGGAP